MNYAVSYIVGLIAAAAILAVGIAVAPGCTPSSPDGFRLGGMLLQGCDRR